MKRLTKNISDKQTYCGYEVKDCKYQQLYDFEEYNELEDYVDCELTLAIDKLGQLEDLEEQLGCPLEVMFKALKSGIYNDVPEYIGTVGLVYINNFYGFMLTCFNSKGLQTGCYPTSEYKKTWWLKGDKSE